jgi:hypothetical protein
VSLLLGAALVAGIGGFLLILLIVGLVTTAYDWSAIRIAVPADVAVGVVLVAGMLVTFRRLAR